MSLEILFDHGAAALALGEPMFRRFSHQPLEGVMRLVLAVGAALALANGAAAQSGPRFELGPVVRVDGLYFEGGTTGTILSGGAAASVRVANRLAVEAEVTQATGRVERSYEGWFVSYVTTPNPTREEIERFAPTARRTLGYEAGIGWSTLLVIRDVFKSRVPVNVRVGGTGRVYRQTSDYVVLTIPEGIDPARVARDFQSSSRERVRGGLLMGAEVPLRLTRRLRLVPGGHVVWSGPARVGNTYREAGLTLRGALAF